MIRVLSRLLERSMLGFSRLVANEVTHPLWPSSTPVPRQSTNGYSSRVLQIKYTAHHQLLRHIEDVVMARDLNSETL